MIGRCLVCTRSAMMRLFPAFSGTAMLTGAGMQMFEGLKTFVNMRRRVSSSQYEAELMNAATAWQHEKLSQIIQVTSSQPK